MPLPTYLPLKALVLTFRGGYAQQEVINLNISWIGRMLLPDTYWKKVALNPNFIISDTLHDCPVLTTSATMVQLCCLAPSRAVRSCKC